MTTAPVPARRRLRWLLRHALPVLVALAVAVPVTWTVATGHREPAAVPELPPVPVGPTSRLELREALLAQLPGADAAGAVLLELARGGQPAAAGRSRRR